MHTSTRLLTSASCFFRFSNDQCKRFIVYLKFLTFNISAEGAVDLKADGRDLHSRLDSAKGKYKGLASFFCSFPSFVWMISPQSYTRDVLLTYAWTGSYATQHQPLMIALLPHTVTLGYPSPSSTIFCLQHHRNPQHHNYPHSYTPAPTITPTSTTILTRPTPPSHHRLPHMTSQTPPS